MLSKEECFLCNDELSTKINFSIPVSGNVSIVIYNLNGEKVTSLSNQYYDIGSYDILWDASNYSSGIYFVQTIIGDYINTQKLVLTK